MDMKHIKWDFSPKAGFEPWVDLGDGGGGQKFIFLQILRHHQRASDNQYEHSYIY